MEEIDGASSENGFVVGERVTSSQAKGSFGVEFWVGWAPFALEGVPRGAYFLLKTPHVGLHSPNCGGLLWGSFPEGVPVKETFGFELVVAIFCLSVVSSQPQQSVGSHGGSSWL